MLKYNSFTMTHLFFSREPTCPWGFPSKMLPVISHRHYCTYKSLGSHCQLLTLFSRFPSWDCGDRGFTHGITSERPVTEKPLTSMGAKVVVCVKGSKRSKRQIGKCFRFLLNKRE